MKWIKSRPNFLNEEAKLKDVLFDKQIEKITSKWGSKWLELEEVEATEDIDQGLWKISEEDKVEALGVFLGGVDLKGLYEKLGKLPKKFVEIIKDSVDPDKIGDKAKVFDENFDISKATIDQLIYMSDPVFRKISVGETKADNYVLKGEDGRPIMGEDGKIQKVEKKAGEPVFSKNLVNINSFITDYNRAFDKDKVDGSVFQGTDVQNILNFAKEDFNTDYEYEINIFGKDMELYIGHDAKEVANMSISKFYSSCQHLYTGGYASQLLANVFDTNSAIAYLKFNAEIHWQGKKISDIIPISRTMIRKVEKYNSTEGFDDVELYFDRSYPDRMYDMMKKLIEKYSKNKASTKSPGTFNYVYQPDIDINMSDELSRPYMDNLRISTGKFIGKNTKKLYLSRSYDWSNIKISPKAKITELIVETTDIPENTFDIEMELEWVKFRFLKLNTIKDFNINTSSYAFDKCNLGAEVIDDMPEDVKKLQFTSCEMGDIDFTKFDKIDELHLVYTMDSDVVLSDVLSENFKPKKFVVSGDMINAENKKYINSLKRKGVKVEIIGPVI